MKYISLLFIMIILAACLSPSTDDSLLPTGEGQGMRETSTPPPTPDTSHLTPDIPTPTTHPQVIAIQEQIAASGKVFTLNADGQIEMQTEEGMTIVPDIKISPDGRMTFTHDGQEFTANTETLEINVQIITFNGTDGTLWAWNGKEIVDLLDEAMTPEEIGHLMSAEEFMNVESLEDVPFVDWGTLNSKEFLRGLINMGKLGLLPPFPDESKIIPFSEGNGIKSRLDDEPSSFEKKYGWGNMWTYENDWKYKDPKTRPYRPILFNTNFGNNESLVSILVFRNQDGSEGFIGCCGGIIMEILTKSPLLNLDKITSFA